MRVITSPWEKEKKLKEREKRVIKDMFFGRYIYMKRIIRKKEKRTKK
jgi:hypothetical protein